MSEKLKGKVEGVNWARQDDPGIFLNGKWLNFEGRAKEFCPKEAGAEAEVELNEEGKIVFIKLEKVDAPKAVSPPVDEKALLAEYGEYAKDVKVFVQSVFPSDEKYAVRLFEKSLSPFKFWRDNKLKAGKISSGA
ncbi:MAG: hypothetical protein ACE5DI_01230 [Candidatus Micrarchaeia archaeon]